MKTRKSLVILIALLMLLSILTACEETKPTDNPQSTQQPTQEITWQPELGDPQKTEQATKEPLDGDGAVDYVINDCGISVAYLSEIKVSYPDDKTIKVTFKYGDEAGLYLFDKATREVLEKKIPEGSKDNTPKDPFEEAINAAQASLEGYNGGAENISVSSSGNIITVKFDWNGNKYEFHYDINTKKIVD